MITMASVLNNTDVRKNDDDEEDLEALRLAALMTLRKKPVTQPSSSSTATFKPHFGNPNLIAIIPEGAEPVVHKRQNFYRHNAHLHPHPHQGRGPPHTQFRGPGAGLHTTLKVLPQVSAAKQQTESKPAARDKADREDAGQEKEEVSTKFSRFEDTESESEDESENEEKASNESSDESEDVLALQDEDDSLEALMAQMEHEIESGIDPEPNKKDKKKSKSNKLKEKEQKSKLDEKSSITMEKTKSETKMAVVEPTVKELDNNMKHEGTKTLPQERTKSSAKTHPIKINKTGNLNTDLVKKASPVHRVIDSDKRVKSKSPTNHRSLTPNPKSPQRDVRTGKTAARRSRSRSRPMSPGVKVTSPVRPKSPRRLTPDRRSSDRYYSGKRSTSPYYKVREREYPDRSRSPVRRKSLSPRRTTREPTPKYYQRRSRSPWSPGYRHSPEGPPRYRSPVRRRSLSPSIKKSKAGYSSHSPFYRGSPKRRTPSVSPRRSNSPMRKREYSPQRRRPSPKRDYNYRRNSLSPRRKQSPPPKKYSPQRSPRRMQRSPSPRRNNSPRRRNSPPPVRECRSKADRSLSPSLSLSPSPPREMKGPNRRFKSPLRPRKEVVNVNSRTSKSKRAHTPDKSIIADGKDKRKPISKHWEKEPEKKPWEKKSEDRRRDRGEKFDRDIRKAKESNRPAKERLEEPKEEDSKVADNPIFEARRKKFESTALIEPASKKIRLVTKKSSPVDDKPLLESKPESSAEDNLKVIENSVQTEEDLLSGPEEIDEIDSFLNEDHDVLDLSAEVWDSDEDLIPRVKKPVTKKSANHKVKSTKKHSSVPEKLSSKEKRGSRKAATLKPPSPIPKGVARSRSHSPAQKATKAENEERMDRDESDLRAELSRRREERLTKAGSLHEKLPRRLLQDAFENALGKKKVKREEKSQKSGKETKKKDKTPPIHKEKSDGRRVLVLKRPAPVKMQTAHINVTFPSKNAESESESSYTSSTSPSPSSEEEERYAAAAPKRKLPVYMRLGTASATTHKRAGRSVKIGSRARRSQLPVLNLPCPLPLCTLVSDYYV